MVGRGAARRDSSHTPLSAPTEAGMGSGMGRAVVGRTVKVKVSLKEPPTVPP